MKFLTEPYGIYYIKLCNVSGFFFSWEAEILLDLWKFHFCTKQGKLDPPDCLLLILLYSAFPLHFITPDINNYMN